MFRKNLALLQAEALARVLELVNVPNVRWLVALCMKPNGAECMRGELRTVDDALGFGSFAERNAETVRLAQQPYESLYLFLCLPKLFYISIKTNMR